MGADQPPPELAPWDDDQERRVDEFCVVFHALAIPLLVAGLCVMMVISLRREYDTVFTVAITGVTGLENDDVEVDLMMPTTSPPPLPPPALMLSPAFNLTFQIENTGNLYYDACVPDFSRADVSYGGAFLAGGSVPPLCAGESRSDRVAARASAENVAVPRFLRDQLAAGDAAVDVKVTLPRYCRHGSCGGAVLSCKPKIGGGASPACRLNSDCPHSISPRD